MIDKSKIPDAILEKIARGQAILFLGAGASHGAMSPSGKPAPSGNTLRDALAERFLGGKMADRPLAMVADLAVNETSLFDVQNYVASTVDNFQPAPFHSLVASFRWKAIFTTNYDLVMERAYEASTNKLQTLKAVIRQDQNLQSAIADASAVPYIKLHGCVTVTNDDQLPLILSSEQYSNHLIGRDRLFQTLQDWARDSPIIFCGYNIADSNIQKILYDLGDSSIHRPMYLAVRPDFEEVEIRYWSQRRVTPLVGTFKDFLETIDEAIPFTTRQLSLFIDQNSSSVAKYIVSGQPSERLQIYLHEEVVHVHSGMPFKAVPPKDFYRGNSGTWGGIQDNLDVRRRVTDDILIKTVLEAEGKQTGVRLFLLKGYAGSGKTITLRRFAWEAAIIHEQLVIWVPSDSIIRQDLICELARICQQHLILVVDDCLTKAGQIAELRLQADKNLFDITVVLGARTNEWNFQCDDLEDWIDDDFELRDLSRSEIDELIKKLGAADELGHIKHLTQDGKRQYFELTAERQLLVALHEANSGKPFVEIILDEFSKVVPTSARDLYLDVSTLHKYGVPIRAGLVSRLSGISLERFRQNFFEPLEHLVRVDYYGPARDYAYRTRHRIIAAAIFDGAFNDADSRADQIIRVIRHMNVEYESDRIAFEQLVRGRDIAEMFSDKRLGAKIFEAALDSSANKVHVKHQWAVFEINHSSKNPNRALELIESAIDQAGGDRAALLHTKAIAHKAISDLAKDELTKEHHRSAAMKILSKQTKKPRTTHAHATLARMLLGQIKEELSASSARGITITGESDSSKDYQLIRRLGELEDCIREALQMFPGDPHILLIESELADCLADEKRCTELLEFSLEKNPTDRFAPIRLSRIYSAEGHVDKAKEILARSISVDPNNKGARLQLALLLISEDERSNSGDIIKLLKPIFSEGDSNHEARFWCARHLYLFGNRDEAKRYFSELRRARVPSETKHRVRGSVKKDKLTGKLFEGIIKSKEDSYLFVHVAQINDDVFCHHSTFPSDVSWEELRVGQKVGLSIGFTFRGPQSESVLI